MSSLSIATAGHLPSRSSLSLASLGYLSSGEAPEVEVGGVGAPRRKRVIYRDELFLEKEERYIKDKNIVLDVEVPTGDLEGLPIDTTGPGSSIHDFDNELDQELARYLRWLAIQQHQQYILMLLEERKRFEEEFLIFLLLLDEQ